jgi:transposase
MTERRQYTREFKLEAVRLSEETEGTIKPVALELGIKPKLLYAWRAAYLDAGKDAFPGQGKVPGNEAEVRALRKELQRVKLERDILKKALSIFSTEG